MNIDKEETNKYELTAFIFVYIVLLVNAIVTKDSAAAIISAFCGITYTILAGKGFPACYLIGVVGSAFYAFLSFKSMLWGNLILYAGYYIPMQILGFFQWNKHLKTDKQEIVKTQLSTKERLLLLVIGSIITSAVILILMHYGDKSPYIDGFTTTFSILGMYLTVKRTLEQWFVWIIVNGLSLLMWLNIVISGEKVYSTVIMWAAYLLLAIYFCILWKKELQKN